LRDEIKNKIQLTKRIKNQTTIKKTRIKIDMKIKWNQMRGDEIEEKNELEKRYKK
jgi:hypothetical protein